ncbi:hypothetical protein [Arthrobacter woluwensis]|uniref:Uncharacterized protein n=1 Tax=Arthrobacter woluwensis TaxID=156980 RepID=A0A1H4LZ85_9MICC|nr:hypothetical protein [Arthrobacter woluwensis]SEB76089.1 hypothetical protein SAMN04489745_1177 [Arthrobacter woluwensis]
MNTHESPQDADQENTDDTAVPRTEAVSTALPATHRFDAAPSADEAAGAPGATAATAARPADDAGEPWHDAPSASATDPQPAAAPRTVPAVAPEERRGGPRVSTIVWGLLIMALAGLLIVSRLGLVALDGTYVLIGLMIGTGAALVIGGLVSAAARRSTAGRTTDHHRTPGSGSGIA